MSNLDREQLADHAHECWSRWMTHLFARSETLPDGSVRIPPKFVTRWRRQITTKYSDLSFDEQESDRREADRIIQLVRDMNEPSGREDG